MAEKLFKVVEWVLVIFLVGLAGLLILSKINHPSAPKIFIVQSGSMEPTIMTGAIVVDKAQSEYAINDIITYGEAGKPNATPTTHRIIEIKIQNGQPIYLTKGDNNKSADTREIKKEEIIGKVLFDVPYVGYALAAAKKPVGFAILIILPAALLIADEVRKIIAELRKPKEPDASNNSEV